MMDMTGKVAIVTGSAMGLGAAVAQKLAARGCNVVINYSKSRSEAETVAESCAAAGVETLLVQADISKDGDCRRLAQEAGDKWGR
ncbi:MAG TPA: oxidoreductase, partial [Alphaproteobacteria bacterium]|nr:oxidoreductase [Alphaproteobacteria bacterium]